VPRIRPMSEGRRMSIWKWVYRLVRLAGLATLAGYLWFERDWRFSLIGVLAYLAISIFVGWTVVALKLSERFPRLNRYAFHISKTDAADSHRISENAWALEQAKYLESQMRGMSLVFSIAEDGLIAVPVLMTGISPLTAALGGFVFGVLHLWRFTYLDCMAKATIYALVCYLVLPFGVIAVLMGHMTTNLTALAVTKAAKRQLARSSTRVG
jgi:hypothetical protein